MPGDFTRSSDEPEKNYSGVLMQQGRVQLDADWNEQAAIQTRALRLALADIIGPYGGPQDVGGFHWAAKGTDSVELSAGIYYVDGIRLELRSAKTVKLQKEPFLACLEVWENQVNAIEAPHIREVALMGPDTAMRSRIEWRIALLPLSSLTQGDRDGLVNAKDEDTRKLCEGIVSNTFLPKSSLRLAARTQAASAPTDPCELSPDWRFRGRENQLYRVEIHGGEATEEPPSEEGPPSSKEAEHAGDAKEKSQGALLFTFKWSRDNGSVVFPITFYAGPTKSDGSAITVDVTVAYLGRDTRFDLEAGDIVEFVNDNVTSPRKPQLAEHLWRTGALGVVKGIVPETRIVTVQMFAAETADIDDLSLHPFLRRWDQRETRAQSLVHGGVPVREKDMNTWIPLEDGVEVLFEWPEAPNAPQFARAGDFWQIPARTATGDVIWPQDVVKDKKRPAQRPPMGIERHFAPLLVVKKMGDKPIDVTRVFKALTALP